MKKKTTRERLLLARSARRKQKLTKLNDTTIKHKLDLIPPAKEGKSGTVTVSSNEEKSKEGEQE